MKSYRNALAALVLAIVFSTSAFAGDGVIYTGITPPPPPPETNGVIYTGVATPAPEEENILTEITLSLLQTLIPLL